MVSYFNNSEFIEKKYINSEGYKMCFFKKNKKRWHHKMKLTWLNNGFICKELYAPFKIDKDIDYRNDLEKKYNIVMEQAKNANADDESLRIINFFDNKMVDYLKKALIYGHTSRISS